jgi:hypothetical protein
MSLGVGAMVSVLLVVGAAEAGATRHRKVEPLRLGSRREIFVDRFMPGRQVVSDAEARRLKVAPRFYKDCSDAILMTSRGGNVYDRTFMESFMRAGIGLQNWLSRSNYPALNVVQTGPAEMSIYVNQEYAQPTAHLRRHSLRLDGFASVCAPYAGGEMITKPFTV